MAYDFAASSSQRISTPTLAAIATPYTLAAWFNVKDGTTAQSVILSLISSTTNQRAALIALGSANGFAVRAVSNDGANSGFSDTGGAYTRGVWHHGCAVFSATNSRTSYLDGVAGAVSTVNISLPNVDTYCIGAFKTATGFSGFSNALVAEAGIWSAALSAAETASLAKGVSPRLVKPQSLIFYAPLMRELVDEARAIALTNNNGATVANHPRVYA